MEESRAKASFDGFLCKGHFLILAGERVHATGVSGNILHSQTSKHAKERLLNGTERHPENSVQSQNLELEIVC